MTSQPTFRADDQDTSVQITQILLEQGVITDKKLLYARRVHAKLTSGYSLTRVLQELRYLETSDLRRVLREHRQHIPLGSLLVELGYLSKRNLRRALDAQQDPDFHGKRLGEILVEKRLVQEQQLIGILADQLGFLHEEPSLASIERELLTKITPEWCRRAQLIPVRREEQAVVVAFSNPLDTNARALAEDAFGEIIPAISTRRAIEDTVTAFEENRWDTGRSAAQVDDASAVDVVRSLILEAINMGASDIHIEPMRQQLRIRMRRDGSLLLHRDLDINMAAFISSRLKVLCGANVAERRRHQGGGFRFEDRRSGRRSDVRASFFSTIFGEKIVLRLLSRKAELLDIKEVGMAPRVLERFLEDALDIPSGVILVTGPTGSGKTTTLYGCVNYLNDMERSITTAEDPVEYVIDGIAQCNLNPKIDVTFEETLRHMVRQDPDVIVLGEIRDHFSAESAIQAALTGHKVLTTFHTEDSIGGLLRLMNMQIETFLISSTVVSVLAQRLLRRVCPQCAEPHSPSAQELHRLGCTQNDLAGGQFLMGRGCRACNYTGYEGRVGIFELLVLNEAVKDGILNRRPSSEIRRTSIATSGLITLLEDGVAKAAAGETSLQEVLRHLPRPERPRALREIWRLVGETGITA